MHLLLVGGGSFLDNLKAKYKNKNVHFIGNHPNPINIVKYCDVGVLPSKLKESLPNSIVEYLFCNIPVIATNVGEVDKMIDAEGMEAGILIPFPSDDVTSKAYKKSLYKALEMMCQDHIRIEFKKYANKAFQKFDMNNCYNRYFSLAMEVVKKS